MTLEFKKESEYVMNQGSYLPPPPFLVCAFLFMSLSFFCLTEEWLSLFFSVANSYQVYILRQQLDRDWNLNLSTKVSGEEPIGPMGSDVYTPSNQMWRWERGGSYAI